MCGEAFSSSRYQNPQPATPPEADGGHDASQLDHDDLVAFANAFLNNRPADLERLRVRLAKESLVRPPRGKSAIADDIVAWLTDYAGDYGNHGGYIDLDDDVDDVVQSLRDGERSALGAYVGDVVAAAESYPRIHALVAEYVAAAG